MKKFKLIITMLFAIFLNNSIAQITFQKAYGGNLQDYAYFVQQTNDGGYIVCGVTNSFGAVYADIYLIKTDSVGDTLWTKIFGAFGDDVGISIRQTSDGGYILSGYTETNTYSDVYLIS